ncbi:unnamed protein product [Trifolium pratense]|uniref:Uncharacterized protein n=1 Tax=Trifolium pratense TaxID=57577 RepID=A0ACB0IZZ7_TRIPR|nr:unnamed protein product [Trifolium pratense]
MRRPSPPKPRRHYKQTFPEMNVTKERVKNTSNTTNHRVKKTSNTTNHSVEIREHYSQTKTRTNTIKKPIVDLSSSRYNSSRKLDDSDDEKGYESTASTPKVDRKRAGKKKAETTTRPTRPDVHMTKGNTSAPPKLKLKHDGPSLLDAYEYDKITRNLFCQPEQDDDRDFHLNYHPSSVVGYEGGDVPFYIPEVSIN